MAIAVDSSREAVGTSHDVSLVSSSPHQPSSPSAPLSTKDVVHQFDATHQLSELTASWGDFATFATSFGEKLQSFSRDHTSFFFSSETKKKLSSKLSTLKAELDLYHAEMEAERQMHQKEEQGLRAQVIEAKKQRDAAIQEASKNSEVMKNLEATKKECNALRVKKQKLSEGIDEMKTLVCSSHNKAEEAQKTIEDLSGKLATATKN
ncbi:uncharacterized protein [Miscanthus floridulus]|uniref:uncharacterized protein n=1 Tax=Miscanthus floridulus TaxID=154761 RepID=UPI003457C679